MHPSIFGGRGGRNDVEASVLALTDEKALKGVARLNVKPMRNAYGILFHEAQHQTKHTLRLVTLPTTRARWFLALPIRLEALRRARPCVAPIAPSPDPHHLDPKTGIAAFWDRKSTLKLFSAFRASRLHTGPLPAAISTTVAGLVSGRQRPSTASGVIGERQRRELLKLQLMQVNGRLEYQSGVLHIIAGRCET